MMTSFALATVLVRFSEKLGPQLAGLVLRLLAARAVDQEWMVRAPAQPRLRITCAALPVKAAKSTSPSTSSAMRRASVVLPVPA